MSRPKEVSFFQDTVDFQPNPNYEKGWDWYKEAFAHYAGEAAVGEATPSYSDRSRSPNTAKRIWEFNPDMKIIYMVRDPLQRQISGWKMQYAFGRENCSPWRREERWALKGFDYWMLMQRDVGQWNECLYGYQLAAYEDFFSSKNICVSFLEDWSKLEANEVNRIMTFVGIDLEKPRLLRPENENRATDRRIDRPLLKNIRMMPTVQTIIKKFPKTWREWARTSVAKAKIHTPSVQLRPETKNDFVEYVRADAHLFLSKYGKSSVLWSALVK